MNKKKKKKKKKEGLLPPGWAEDGVDDAREGEAYARIGSEGVDGGLADKVFDGLHEEIQAPDRRHVQRQRHRREGHREK